jgi:hypothetical protein
MMTGKKENGHRTKIEIEIYSDKDGDYFIEVLNQNHPWGDGEKSNLKNVIPLRSKNGKNK